MKKIIFIVFVVLIIFSFCGCFFDIDQPQIRVNMKQDVMSDNGISAAVSGDRIYYVSNEEKTSGIYSMKMDGSDVKRELSNPSVLSLQIDDQEVIYCGIYEANKDQFSTVEITGYYHKIYRYNVEIDNVITDEDIGVLNKFYSEPNFCQYYSAADGSMVAAGQIFPSSANELQWTDIIGFSDGSRFRDKEFFCKFKFDDFEQELGLDLPDREFFERIYLYGDILVFGGESPVQSAGNSIIDTKTGEIIYAVGSDNAIFLDDNKIYLGVVAHDDNSNICMLIEYDLNTNNIRPAVYENVASNSCFVWAKESDDKLLVMSENADDYNQIAMYPSDQALHILDIETLELDTVFTAAENEQILGVLDDRIVTLNNGDILRYDFENNTVGSSVKIAEIPEIKNNIIQTNKKYQVDFAGDWMFFYKIHGGYTMSIGEDIAQQLLCKINIKTGEVIKNTEDINYAQLDYYR